jgi:hypothetical protein
MFEIHDFQEESTEEQVVYTFDLLPRTLDHFQERYEVLLQKPEHRFLRNLVLFRYLDIREGESSVFASVWNTAAVVIGTETDRRLRLYQNLEEMIPDLLKLFPKLSLELLTKATGLLNKETRL